MYDHIVANHSEYAEHIGIWNGDIHTPARRSSFVTLCTPLSLFNRLLEINSDSDVQHTFYDEIHDASHWSLLLLSCDLFRITKKNAKMKSVMKSATTSFLIIQYIVGAQQVSTLMHVLCIHIIIKFNNSMS